MAVLKTTNRASDRMSNAAFRDKRYKIPVLSVDLFEKVYPTTRWSMQHLILTEYTGHLQQGDEFSGCFTFEHHKEFGLFEGFVARADPKKQMLGIELRQLSKDGQTLLDYMNGLRTPDQPDKGREMRVSITYRTINWSLTGMLLDRYFGGLGKAQEFRGMVRSDRAHESGIFAANVVRYNEERRTLAMKFTSLSPETFELLEDAIKKQGQLHHASGGTV